MLLRSCRTRVWAREKQPRPKPKNRVAGHVGGSPSSQIANTAAAQHPIPKMIKVVGESSPPPLRSRPERRCHAVLMHHQVTIPPTARPPRSAQMGQSQSHLVIAQPKLPVIASRYKAMIESTIPKVTSTPRRPIVSAWPQLCPARLPISCPVNLQTRRPQSRESKSFVWHPDLRIPSSGFADVQQRPATPLSPNDLSGRGFI